MKRSGRRRINRVRVCTNSDVTDVCVYGLRKMVFFSAARACVYVDWSDLWNMAWRGARKNGRKSPKTVTAVRKSISSVREHHVSSPAPWHDDYRRRGPPRRGRVNKSCRPYEEIPTVCADETKFGRRENKSRLTDRSRMQ